MKKNKLINYKVIRYSDDQFDKVFSIFYRFQHLSEIELVLPRYKKQKKSIRAKKGREKEAFLFMMDRCNQKFVGIDQDTGEPYAFAFLNAQSDKTLNLTLVAIDPDYTYSKTCGDSLREIFEIFSAEPEITEVKAKLFKRNKWEKYLKFVDRFGFKAETETNTHVIAKLQLKK